MIVHFAAESHVDRSIDGPTEFIQTNVVGAKPIRGITRMAKSLKSMSRMI